jgi:hypothetical protein
MAAEVGTHGGLVDTTFAETLALDARPPLPWLPDCPPADNAQPPTHTSPGAVPLGTVDRSRPRILVPPLRNAVAGRVTVFWSSFLIPCAPPVGTESRYLDYHCAMIPRQMQRKQAQSPSEVLLMKTLPSAFPITTPLIPTRGPAHGTPARPCGPAHPCSTRRAGS